MSLQPHDDADRIRVSDAEREHIVELLGQAAAEGRLSLEEYADRATSAHSAQTRGELARLTDDLPVGRSMAAGSGVSATARRFPTRTDDEAPEHLVAVFGAESRKGFWRVPAWMRAISVFGDCHLEMQDAQLENQVTVIEVFAVFGAATLFVPEGIDVRLTGTAVFGSKESKLRGPVTPGAPVIEVRSRVVFGSVEVRLPKRKKGSQ
ncbi:DUF1707 domain-containing protein [Plantactinospora sp. GCM10030261]|uniref:DUF1707 SHOCT-like domain-containing protein n=1 Tax=Plantactinospora sp. GCM10030261 TaxID=3273420 RepID=UPI0036061B5B